MKRINVLLDKKDDQSKLSIAIMGIVALILFLISILIDAYIPFPNSVKSALCTLLSTIAAILVANGCWEIIVKDRFARHILKLANISQNIDESGIKEYYNDFKDIDWEIQLQGTTKIEAVFTYSTNLIQGNLELFRTLIIAGCQIDIFLPNPNDENMHVLSSLSMRFHMPEKEIQEKIRKAIEAYSEQKCKIYLYDGTFQNSFYRTNRDAFMSFFTHKQSGKNIHEIVPVIRTGVKGKLYEYISSEIEFIRKVSNEYNK